MASIDGKTFLYVEDDALSQEIMKLIIEDMLGAKELKIFGDSGDILQRLETIPVPSIIFLDIHIEPYSGMQVLEMIRTKPNYANVPIIAVTASVMNDEVQQLRQAGFDGGIGKPIDQDVFPELIDRILNGEEVWHVT